MTSEVAVMNRLGVALASDSAASVRIRNRTKLYHADKLFMLSKARPVGVMVNNSSSLVGVPWETIIKAFRNHLGAEAFDSLQDYSRELVRFLNGSTGLFPQDAQDEVYLDLFSTYLQQLDERITTRAVVRAIKHGEKGVLAAVTDEVIKEALQEWESSPDLQKNDFSSAAGDSMVSRLSGRLLACVVGAQLPSPLNGEQQSALFRIARLIVTKQLAVQDGTSGLVIAGFGEKDHFPVLQELQFYGIYDGALKCREVDLLKVTHAEPAKIRAFAQSEVVDSFLYGCSPSLYRWIAEDVTAFLVGQAEVVVDGFPTTRKTKKNEYKEKVRALMKDMAVELLRDIGKRRVERYYDPIVGSIEHLPKNELAHVASTLVSLSSFQKRVSLSEDETVGGPVDVAVITKGDGFVWVDRKHYFKADLNPHYFSNRFTHPAASAAPAPPTDGQPGDQP
jgi:hypothetical protein